MKTLGIVSPLMSPGLRRMLDALGLVMDIRFEERTFGEDAGVDAWIFPEADHEAQRRITHCSCPCYAVIRSTDLEPCGVSTTIEFSRDQILPHVLSGRRIMSDEAAKFMALPCQSENMIVLASKAGAPVWSKQEVDGQQHHYVSLPIPELNEGEAIFQYFHGEQFLSLLPLLVFLRSFCVDRSWEGPPLQGCFMFDDPNLHWRTYGFVNFAEMARHAQACNYHATFATIPLDKWFVHKPTALLFRQYHDQLSLLIHGNNHIAQELARTTEEEDLKRDLQQALRRINEFECCSGLEVSKVMAPPHGACGETSLRLMAQLGFEAACVSRGSLAHHNGQATWVRTLGMRPLDIVAGLSIFPRFRISSACHNSILIAAMLDQAIIPVGHHHDVADGLQLLEDLSGFVNSLGAVHWGSMEGISRSHYARKLEGNVLQVRMFTNRIEVQVPEGVDQVIVERSWLRRAGSGRVAWRYQEDEASVWKFHDSDSPISVPVGRKIEIISRLANLPVPDGRSATAFRMWPVVRRQLTETRDRVAPLLKRIAASSNKVTRT